MDPGGVIEKEGLGVVAHGDMDKLIKVMKSIDNSENFAGKSIEYIKENHQLNSNMINKIEFNIYSIRYHIRL